MLMHHKKQSSLWVPQSVPIQETVANTIVPIFHRDHRHPAEDKRHVTPNFQYEGPRYKLESFRYPGNFISTTKYTILTFPFKNFCEQMKRWANWFFFAIIVLNFFPQFAAFNRFLGIIPVVVILSATAIKDAYEDFRRWRMDNKVNNTTCMVWDRNLNRFRRMCWKHVLVGDFVHISNNDLIPADILLLRSADSQGICFIETSNLDGETSLKQKLVPKSYARCSEDPNANFDPLLFNNDYYCIHPTASVADFSGFIKFDDRQENIGKDNMLWRGCRLKNTTFVEGIVLYSGKDTKVMMNNGRAQSKRSSVERMTNGFILACLLMLVVMCLGDSLGNAFWNKSMDNLSTPYLTDMINWWLDGVFSIGAFIITYQVLVPLSLYITVELIKLGLFYFMEQDLEMYDEEKDARLQVRNLTIPEELGQITHVLSDKTGTITENVMMFRRCAFDETDYGAIMGKGHNRMPSTGLNTEQQLYIRVLANWRYDIRLRHFFTNLAICNTVVVNREHKDMIEIGSYAEGVYTIDNSQFYTVTEDEFKRRQEVYKVNRDRIIRFQDEAPPRPDRPVSEDTEDSAVEDMSSDELEPTLSRVSTFSQKLVHRISSLPVVRSLISSPSGSVNDFRTRRGLRGGKRKKKESKYEAESPDEYALVQGAAQYGFVLEERGATHVTLELPDHEKKRFEVLKILPFDSKRKRMSIIVRGPRGPILYTKGADSAILPRLAEPSQTNLLQFDELDEAASSSTTSTPVMSASISVERARALLHKYACRGLRTLAYGMRQLTHEEYEEFRENYDFIELDTTGDREQMLAEVADRIERDFDLLGVTGVEDKLQDGVKETIWSLREAGMQVWLLTGDKLETAENIARSCGLFDLRVPNLHIENLMDVSSSEGTATRCNIILAPEVLTTLKSGDPALLEVVKRSACVLCYRMTPAEKSEVVTCVKNSFKGRVLAIGDGANDVPMIQAAHVGVGVSGNEGMQAVMASDFAIARFKFLRRLLLVHGHWNYDRIANTYLYFLYKNAMLVFVIFFCQFYNGYSGESPMDPIYSMFYPIIFTSVQPIIYGVYDQCHDSSTLLARPSLYKITMDGRCYTWKLFFWNMIDAIYQAAICYYGCHLCYWDTFSSLWEFGFTLCTSMFLVNCAHLAIEIRCWTWPIAFVFSFFTLLHFVFFLVYHAMMQPEMQIKGNPVWVSYRVLGSFEFYATEVITVTLALLPRLLYRVVLSVFDGRGASAMSCFGFTI